MKKISLVLSALVLFAGVSFANPMVKKHVAQKTDTKQPVKSTKSVKKGGKKGGKSVKKEAAATK
ncbi:MAG TPA: hypothetical protein VN922_21085 [Bacteroidia bacterium]|nr:hypothetical protein [Bacteroidia bacterium]